MESVWMIWQHLKLSTKYFYWMKILPYKYKTLFLDSSKQVTT